ncbi:NAD(P)H-hydrate dehydratase [Labedella endophytica]|uniref:ADP-dependent (S)-NAD(P)H-hydrate dehydratase n=1 Tax=Labedella endophytica TaxID=1523160 RepID=A0A3S0XJE8_9MICO|nr:NAD(P)H-hydrate dehydratase [Labedella endophytica]RUQ96781.1 NAD(P)H-hydrate dehydratase [Labedella endophytica]
MSARADRVTPRLLRRWGQPEPGESKYDRGVVLIVGGARRSPGAVALAGVAALRVGAGRLTLAAAGSVADGLAIAIPECGIVPLGETETGGVRGDAAGALASDLEKSDAVLFGPGLDDVDAAAELLDGVVDGMGADTIVVLDAFALPAVRDDPARVDALAGRLILTPNPTELALLAGVDELRGSDTKAVLRAARAVAARLRAVVATQNLIVGPGGDAWSVHAGNPGLGTSGSGDALAGAIAGMAARGVGATRAAVWGTYVHAAAGDRLADSAPIGFLARELADHFPSILGSLR